MAVGDLEKFKLLKISNLITALWVAFVCVLPCFTNSGIIWIPVVILEITWLLYRIIKHLPRNIRLSINEIGYFVLIKIVITLFVTVIFK